MTPAALTPAALSAAGTGASPFWFATRALGVVALVLLTATVILGIAGTARFATPGLPRVVTAGLHRNLSLLVLALVAMHVLTTIADGYAPIGLASAVVPFDSAYRGLWLGLGTIAFDMLLAVAVTAETLHAEHRLDPLAEIIRSRCCCTIVAALPKLSARSAPPSTYRASVRSIASGCS